MASSVPAAARRSPPAADPGRRFLGWLGVAWAVPAGPAPRAWRGWAPDDAFVVLGDYAAKRRARRLHARIEDPLTAARRGARDAVARLADPELALGPLHGGPRSPTGKTDARGHQPRAVAGFRSCADETLHTGAGAGCFGGLSVPVHPDGGRGVRSGRQAVGTTSLIQPRRPQADAKAEAAPRNHPQIGGQRTQYAGAPPRSTRRAARPQLWPAGERPWAS
jgi:hypothetical protein